MERDHGVGQSVEVRTRLLGAPWWVLAIISGVPFTAVMVVLGTLDDGPVVRTVVSAVVMGSVLGVYMGVFQARMNRRTRAAVAVPADREAAVYRSAMKGPVPDDPETRAAAARLVAHLLDQARRNLRWAIVGSTAFALLGAWLAVTSSPRWWGAVLLWCAFLGWSVLLPSRLGRRLALLDARRDACAPPTSP